MPLWSVWYYKKFGANLDHLDFYVINRIHKNAFRAYFCHRDRTEYTHRDTRWKNPIKFEHFGLTISYGNIFYFINCFPKSADAKSTLNKNLLILSSACNLLHRLEHFLYMVFANILPAICFDIIMQQNKHF